MPITGCLVKAGLEIELIAAGVVFLARDDKCSAGHLVEKSPNRFLRSRPGVMTLMSGRSGVGK